MSRKILIADDEQHILESLVSYLKQDGFQVVTARNGREAVFVFRHEQPDLVILDIMMPEMDGREAAKVIRKESSVPLIFLTARIEEVDQIAGLEIGADEYITKPFSPRVVVARVRAIFRRVHGELTAEPAVFRIKALELNTEARLVYLDGKRVDLTPSEFGILKALITRPGRVFTRMELLDMVQGEAFAGYERTIDVHVKNLRLKIETDPRNPEYIETAYGVGYRMRAENE